MKSVIFIDIPKVLFEQLRIDVFFDILRQMTQI